MLYQLDTTLGFQLVVLDCVVVALLAYSLLKTRGTSAPWLPTLCAVILAIPLGGIKLLASSSGALASSPGLVIVGNPEHRITKLYYLRNYPKGTWQVDWVEYVLSTDKETVLEMEGHYGMKVAYKQAGNWYYAPIRLGDAPQTEINLPQDFTVTDTSGQIESAVASHAVSEFVSWLSAFLTIGSIGLLAALIREFMRRPTTKAVLNRA